MDFKKLITDIVTLNQESLHYRWKKIVTWKNNKLIGIKVLVKGKNKFLKEIPVIINNRNRYSYLLRLIHWIEEAGMKNIYIIDNDSTYPPLLEYYKSIPYTVFRLKENVGHMALWETEIIKSFDNSFYIYSDPDILPSEECKHEFMQVLFDCLKKYTHIEKAGFALHIDDLPEHYSNKYKVMEWESQFWKTKLDDIIYSASIDTTFALYRPYSGNSQNHFSACRVAGKFTARHLPWYENSSQPTEEEIFYRSQIREGASHWISKTE